MTRWSLALAVAAVGLLLAALPARPPRIVFNPSASAPMGWWLIGAATALQVGDYVLVELPPAVAAFAGERGYLPQGVPILKRVAALAGQRVCIVERVVSIDGVPLARALTHDRAQRVLPVWPQCRVLTGDEVFLFNPHRTASFDSRYFGPLQRAAVRGVAHPLWTWNEP